MYMGDDLVRSPENWVLSWSKTPLLQHERTLSLREDDDVRYLD